MTTYDIMVDVDDVLFPLAVGLHAKAHEMGLHDNTTEALEVWHGWIQYGCEKQRWLDVFDALLREGFYVNERPIPGTVEALRRLHWAGHRIHIVTARGFMENGENIRGWTRDYLATFGIGHDTLTFSKDKAAAQAELGLEYDYALDDGLHNFEALTEAGVNVYLQDAPHNRHYETDRRVGSLWEFSNLVLAESKYASFKPRFVQGVGA